MIGFAVGGMIGLGVWNHDVKLAQEFLIKNGVDPQYHNQIINSFKYRVKVKSINSDTLVYRYFSDPSRRISYWVTPKQYANPIKKLALAFGNNTASYSTTLTLKEGAQFLCGTVARAVNFLGGGIQYYVPNLFYLI